MVLKSRSQQTPPRTAQGLVGHEPPLLADAARAQMLDRRGVNARWLGATILTGIVGAGLMGGAVWASLEEQTRPPRPAELINLGQRGTASERMTNFARKGDKLTPLVDAFSSTKQTVQVSNTFRTGDREITRTRPYTRVVAAISLQLSGGVEIPPFNPLRLLAGDTGADKAEDDGDLDSDGEVMVVSRDLAQITIDPTSVMQASVDAVMNKVREAAIGQYFLPLINPSDKIAAEPAAGATSADQPANVLVVEKRIPDSQPLAATDRTLVSRPGDTLTTLMLEASVTRDDARAITTALTKNGRPVTMPEGQRLRIEFGQLTPTARVQPVRVTIFTDKGQDGAVALTDEGRYVPVELLVKNTSGAATESEATDNEDGSEDDEGSSTGTRLYNALYETALRQDMPKRVIDEMIRLFANDVDFNRRAQQGDQFEVFYAEDEADSGRVEILFAALNHGGEARRYYRFMNPEENTPDYYDEKGKSARKFLIRKPIAGGIMRSTFGMRRHPVMRYTKMHTGVDWADRVGTPIVAAGNGTVTTAGWHSGYGRRIEIEHANGYTTTYNHMSGFARGVSEGTRVRQGQVIGYLGNSGLSTGPHLHYEVMVNGRFVDPLRVRVPRGRELEGKAFAAFQAEKARIDQWMTRDPATARLSAAQR